MLLPLKKHHKKILVVLNLLIVSFFNTIPVQALGVNDFYSDSNIQFYDPTACDPNGSNNTPAAVPSASGDTLEGHKLPASSGGTGNEDPVDASGHLTTTGESLTFGNFASKGEKYRDYYITMRWTYAKWDWSGAAPTVNDKDKSWYGQKPRKVLVTNPKTNKSIIAVIMESGPAPYAGAKGSQNENGYSSPQSETPANYTGRVSGFPPKAISALGASQTENGSGDKLLYSWAPDQNTDPGPVADGTVANDGSINPQAAQTSGCCPTSDTSAPNSLRGSANEEKVWNWLIDKGFTPEQAAGVMGNMQQENGFKTDDNSGGLGIVQWIGSRRAAAIDLANKTNRKPTDLSLQLDYLWSELKGGYKPAYDAVKKATTIEEAEAAFENDFEHPGIPARANRVAYAHALYRVYKNNPGLLSDPASSVTGSCSCPSSSQTSNVDVVLDPGHSPKIDQNSRDAKTGLYTFDYENDPEMGDAYKAAQNIEKILTSKNYKVSVTKTSADEKIDLAERADRGNKTNAPLMVTMHSNGNGATFLAYPDKNSKRSPPGGRKDGTDGLVHPDVETKSEDYAKKMAPIIEKTVSSGYRAQSFNDVYGADGLKGNGKNVGNTPVQTILTSIPEVYSEVKQADLPTDNFANAMADAIVQVVKPGGASSTPGGGGCAQASLGGLAATIKSFAWPSYHAAPYIRMEPAWGDVVDKSSSNHDYVGGRKYAGIDCGGFVTQAIVKSGFDPGYNHSGKTDKGAGGTDIEEAWAKSNWQHINPSSTKDLQPGDVAFRISGGHTYVFVGKIPGFHSVTASSSLDDRAPMAGSDPIPDTSNFTWYRKK